jgi:hypothetical protein
MGLFRGVIEESQDKCFATQDLCCSLNVMEGDGNTVNLQRHTANSTSSINPPEVVVLQGRSAAAVLESSSLCYCCSLFHFKQQWI